MNKTEKAKELFLEGYNCAQAIVGAFCDEVGLDFDTAMRLSSSFGAGMGRLREVCGTVSGVFMLAGLKYGYSTSDRESKANHYRLIQSIAKRFKDRNGSIICRELLEKRKNEKESYEPDERTEDYYKRRPCLAVIEVAAEIAKEVLSGEIFNHLI